MVPTTDIDIRRIFKNTIALYLRILLSMAISLYTSRIVLQALGIDDYGIYGLVGGIVALFSFLNATMSAATSRYLTVGLAKDDTYTLHKTFSTAVILHIGIAIFVFLLAETLGLWIILEKLNIPEGRIRAAIWVYQFSIMSAMTSIVQVPYNSLLISHEKMTIYAMIDIIGALIKLGIAIVLLVVVCDKLILYGGLMLLETIIIALLYMFYSTINYPESRGSLSWDKKIGRSLFSYSGWNLYSNLCFTGRQQGTNMLLNVFGSTAVNAASGLSTSVQLMIEQFSTNLVMASRPQIIKLYALNNLKSMLKLFKHTAILANLLYILIAVPFIAEIHYLMNLWLVEVPDYTIEFCILMVIASFISLNNNIINIGIQAVGRMRFYSLMAGTVSLSVIPILWIMLKGGAMLTVSYILPIISNFIIYIVSAYTFHYYAKDFKPVKNFIETFLLQLLIASIAFFVVSYVQDFIIESFMRLLLSILLSTSIILIISNYVLLNKSERARIITVFKNKLSWKGNH